MSKSNTYADKTLAELSAVLVELEAELNQTKLSHLAKELVNPKQISKLRKEIARVKTAINDPNINESEEE